MVGSGFCLSFPGSGTPIYQTLDQEEDDAKLEKGCLDDGIPDSSSERALYPRGFERARSWDLISFPIGFLSGILITLIITQFFSTGIAHSKALPEEFAPEMPRKTITFTNIAELSDRPSPEANAAWNNLMPFPKSWVLIEHPEAYNLQPGVLVSSLGIERFSVSMYHQLHCLQFIRSFYWSLVDTIEQQIPHEEAIAVVHAQLEGSHVQHCLSYLVQAVQCSADLSIEWARVEKDGSRFQTTGMGIPHHQCKDPEAVRRWMERVHAPDEGSEDGGQSGHGHGH